MTHFVSGSKAVIKGSVDSRKIAAFVFWGLITKDGEKLKLTTRGWELARKTKTREQVLREILDSVVPYRSALEWVHHQKLDTVTNADVASHWHEHHSDSLGSENENTIKDQAVCFFRIAEAAGLGKMTVGRKGASTRLEIARNILAEYVEAGPATPPLSESLEESALTNDKPNLNGTQTTSTQPKPVAVAVAEVSQQLRVFITHGKNLKLVEQVGELL